MHDFRAPSIATSGYCGLVPGEALGPLADEQKEVLRRVQHSTKRLSRMTSAMFFWERRIENRLIAPPLGRRQVNSAAPNSYRPPVCICYSVSAKTPGRRMRVNYSDNRGIRRLIDFHAIKEKC
jgi:hypothetical protein